MEPLIPRFLFGHARSTATRQITVYTKHHDCRAQQSASSVQQQIRCFAVTARHGLKEREEKPSLQQGAHGQPAHKLSHNVTKEEEKHYDKMVERSNEMVEHSKQSQLRSPWMREGSDSPPVARQRSAGAMTKGKLLTTPSRMLKLILPLSTKDVNKDRKDLEPLALLVHPQQPLSYLERLIQSELPVLKNEEGNERIPSVYFRAEDTGEDSISPDKHSTRVTAEEADEHSQKDDEVASPDETRIDGKVHRTGKIGGPTTATEPTTRNQQPKDAPDPDHPNFVRWSPSTEIGDFIRDASRGKEFSIDIEGAPAPIYVAVPSFRDRTYYLRLRLRKTAKEISRLADVKTDCDKLAHKGAQRVAQGGFAILIGWWYLVYRLTFETELGWDVMEPVTYLVGLSTLIGGYMWFLYHNREVSYRSAMNFTVSRRQSKLYEQRGFDLNKWEGLMEEGNRLRREIKLVADEYDVEWDERQEEGSDKVAEALRKDRIKNKEEDSEDNEDDRKERKKEGNGE